MAALLRYGSSVRRLPPEALVRETLAVRSALYATAENSIKLALLLSAPGSPLYDLDGARDLLAQLALERRLDSAYVDLASLLHEMLNSHNGMDAELSASERARLLSLEAELREREAALQSERAQRQTLEGQLEALRAIEDQINRRADQLQGDRAPQAEDADHNGGPASAQDVPGES